jgi:hypothetical protein
MNLYVWYEVNECNNITLNHISQDFINHYMSYLIKFVQSYMCSFQIPQHKILYKNFVFNQHALLTI